MKTPVLILLNLFANLAMSETYNSNSKCKWLVYQEKLPEEFDEFFKDKK